jgi:hypothetical protein
VNSASRMLNYAACLVAALIIVIGTLLGMSVRDE